MAGMEIITMDDIENNNTDIMKNNQGKNCEDEIEAKENYYKMKLRKRKANVAKNDGKYSKSGCENQTEDIKIEICESELKCEFCGSHFNCNCNHENDESEIAKNDGKYSETGSEIQTEDCKLEIYESELKCEFCGSHFNCNCDRKNDESEIDNSQRKFQCECCGKGFESQYLLKDHLVDYFFPQLRVIYHFLDKECTHCDKKFEDQNLLLRHIGMSHDALYKLVSEETKIMLKTVNSFRKKPILFKSGKYHCQYCNIRIDECVKFKQHLVTHFHDELTMHHNGPGKCPQCDKKFNTPYLMNKHIAMSHNMLNDLVSLYTLKQYQPFFKRKPNISKKVDTEKSKLALKCEYCGKWLKSKVNLKAHLPSHFSLELSKFFTEDGQCSFCDMEYGSIMDLKRHLAWKHDILKELLSEKSLKQLDLKSKSSQATSDENSYHCEHCDKKFHFQIPFKSHLCTRMQFREELKKFQNGKSCSVCHFKSSSSCSVCRFKSSSSNSSQLIQHIGSQHNVLDQLTSTEKQKDSISKTGQDNVKDKSNKKDLQNDKMHQCQKCGKKFKQKNSLNKHFDTAHSEIKHKCEMCGMGFKYMKSLGRHMKSKHKLYKHIRRCKDTISKRKKHTIPKNQKKKYSCQQCEKGFKTNYNLYRHIEMSTHCSSALDTNDTI